MTARRGNETIHWRHTNVYHVRDGKIAEIWQHPFQLNEVGTFFA